MRKIAFRAWDSEKEVMMTGTNQYGCDEPSISDDGYSSGSFTRLWEALARFEESERFALMQYTGLKSKSGQEIYEGDIIQSDDKLRRWSVEYSASQGGRYIGKGLGKTWNSNLPPFSDLEIIGNIYESPKLKEEVEDDQER